MDTLPKTRLRAKAVSTTSKNSTGVTTETKMTSEDQMITSAILMSSATNEQGMLLKNKEIEPQGII
jgi:hypothetical protein